MYRSQQLALKYLTAAIALFGVMTIAGLISAYYYINSNFLFGLLDFNIAKILHIDTLIIWLLMGFMGAIYWFLPEEFGIEIAGRGSISPAIARHTDSTTRNDGSMNG
jgi:nitric oxide reductase subunit B